MSRWTGDDLVRNDFGNLVVSLVLSERPDHHGGPDE
jgi:hypothetical protein